jgi:hypothetical protein
MTICKSQPVCSLAPESFAASATVGVTVGRESVTTKTSRHMPCLVRNFASQPRKGNVGDK